MGCLYASIKYIYLLSNVYHRVLGVLKVSVSIVLHFLDLVVAIAHLMIMMIMVIEVKTNGERGKSSLLAAAVLKFREGKKKISENNLEMETEPLDQQYQAQY